MYRVEIQDASSRLQELMDAAMRGERVVISRNLHDAVRLVPVRKRSPGSARGRIHMSDDFDDPVPDFEPYSP
jgi:prevent-host-death family protein